jgi:phosphoribosylanthranilate isomerase
MTRIKICCIQDREELALAVAHGADAVGLVSTMPTGPGPISDEKIAELARATPPGVTSFLLTSLTEIDAIAAQVERCHPQVIQLVDEVPQLARLKILAKIVQVIHVADRDSLAQAERVFPFVDALLLDSGSPKNRELGGTGRVHDWEISRAIVERSPVPVWLAGGLNSENVAKAIALVRPFGVDVCNGVRSENRLDAGMLGAFVRVIQSSDSQRRENA